MTHPPHPCSRARRAGAAALLAALAPGALAAGDLMQLSLEQLVGMKVTGASKYEQRQADVAAAVSVITRQDIRAFGWRTLDEAIGSLPGMSTAYDRQYHYFAARGFGLPGDFNTRVLVTINGNRVNDAVFDAGWIGHQFPLDLDLVERIEFIPGPGGAVHGYNAMLGVINVVTREAASFDGVRIAAGAEQPQRQLEGSVSGGWKLAADLGLVLSASALRSQGEDVGYDFGSSGIRGTARDQDGRTKRQLFGALQGGNWSLDAVVGRHRKDDPTGAFLSDPLVPGQWQGDDYALWQAQWHSTLGAQGPELQVRVFAGTERYTGNLSYGGTTSTFFGNSRWRGAEARLLVTRWSGHKLMLGLEHQDNPVVEQGMLDPRPGIGFCVFAPSRRTGYFVQDEWHLAPGWLATLGARSDHASTAAAGSTFSPRAALIWQAAHETTVKALAGRAHRAPNSFERDYSDGSSSIANPALAGERIDTLELVAEHQWSRSAQTRASVYRWVMRDLITLGVDPVSGIPQYRNGGSVRAQGLELAGDAAWGPVRVRGSLSFQDVGYVRGGEPANAPKRLGRLQLVAPLAEGLALAWDWRYDGPRLAIDGSRLGGFAVSHFNLAATRLAPGLEVSLGVRNVFDKRYAAPGADTNWQNTFEQDGRSWRVLLRHSI